LEVHRPVGANAVAGDDFDNIFDEHVVEKQIDEGNGRRENQAGRPPRVCGS
jgi:hypothetical protein